MSYNFIDRACIRSVRLCDNFHVSTLYNVYNHKLSSREYGPRRMRSRKVCLLSARWTNQTIRKLHLVSGQVDNQIIIYPPVDKTFPVSHSSREVARSSNHANWQSFYWLADLLLGWPPTPSRSQSPTPSRPYPNPMLCLRHFWSCLCVCDQTKLLRRKWPWRACDQFIVCVRKLFGLGAHQWNSCCFWNISFLVLLLIDVTLSNWMIRAWFLVKRTSFDQGDPRSAMGPGLFKTSHGPYKVSSMCTHL